MKYIEYELTKATNGSPQPLYDIDTSFSGCTYYNSETDKYYGTYDDVSLIGLPSWAGEITSTEYNDVKAAILIMGKNSLKSSLESFGNDKINTVLPNLIDLQMEGSYAQNAIPGICNSVQAEGVTADNVVTNSNTMLSSANTLNALHDELDDIPDKDTDIGAYIPASVVNTDHIAVIKAYYKVVMEGIVKYRLRRLVKNWITTKSITVDGYTESELNAINDMTFFDDCPDI